MSDAVLFVLFFSLLVIVRIVAATAVFYCFLPQGDQCPECSAPTLRVASRAWNILMPWFRTSWCIDCGWEGLLRHGEISHDFTPASPTSSDSLSFRQEPPFN